MFPGCTGHAKQINPLTIQRNEGEYLRVKSVSASPISSKPRVDIRVHTGAYGCIRVHADMRFVRH